MPFSSWIQDKITSCSYLEPYLHCLQILRCPSSLCLLQQQAVMIIAIGKSIYLHIYLLACYPCHCCSQQETFKCNRVLDIGKPPFITYFFPILKDTLMNVKLSQINWLQSDGSLKSTKSLSKLSTALLFRNFIIS